MSATVTMGPLDIPPNTEKTVCIVKSLGNSQDMVISSMDSTLAPGSHHLLVYRTTAPENLTPTPCKPFGGVGTGTDEPLLVATTPTGSWIFPSGVGLELKPNQMLRIEAHYLNTAPTDIQGQGTVTFHGALASATTFQSADVLVWGTLKISVPAGSQATTPIIFQAGMAGTHMMSVSTHEHRFGTRVQAWASANASDQSRQIADDTDWASPKWSRLAPPLDFDGTNGISYQCSWNNTSAQPVTFGESALDEMCFVIGYFYPAAGSQVCLDGRCEYRTPAGSDAGASAGAGDGSVACKVAADCGAGQVCCGLVTPKGTVCQAGPCSDTIVGPIQLCASSAECFTSGDVCGPFPLMPTAKVCGSSDGGSGDAGDDAGGGD